MVDLYKYEKELYKNGCKYIGGVDEVGRGPLIGSVVAACVILPPDFVCLILQTFAVVQQTVFHEGTKPLQQS